jgi:PIN domain nuclease of toxin-antitoxin system
MKPGESLLLDTHVWLWLLTGERGRVSEEAWTVIEQAAERQAIGVSEISFWEIANKARKRQLELQPDAREWLRTARERAGIGVIEIDRDVLVQSALLEMEHGDPADRILVATALRYDMRLATTDDALLRYAQHTPQLKILR